MKYTMGEFYDKFKQIEECENELVKGAVDHDRFVYVNRLLSMHRSEVVSEVEPDDD